METLVKVKVATTPVTSLSRDELIKELVWNSGGYGFGICSFAASMMWSEDRPTPEKPDFNAIVAVNTPPEKYTDAELRWLVKFSRHVTAKYDSHGHSYRRGANMIIIGRPEHPNGSWLRKRMSWTHGPMYSRTLLDALSTMIKH